MLLPSGLIVNKILTKLDIIKYIDEFESISNEQLYPEQQSKLRAILEAFAILPDVITDVVESQKEMRKYAQNLDMVIMIATMLHSIATGNMLPSRVKTICVDINPSTVTKLSDRGSAQVVGIVTDIGTFLPLLYNALQEE